MIQKAVAEKVLKPLYLAYTIDRINMSKDLPQVYGTQYDRDANGRTILYKIDDIEKVNWRRMRIGLGATTVPE